MKQTLSALRLAAAVREMPRTDQLEMLIRRQSQSKQEKERHWKLDLSRRLASQWPLRRQMASIEILLKSVLFLMASERLYLFEGFERTALSEILSGFAFHQSDTSMQIGKRVEQEKLLLL